MNIHKMTNVVSLFLTISTSQVMSQNEATKPLLEAVSQRVSAGDTRGLMNSLPDIKGLRDQDLISYLEAAKLAAPSLIKAAEPEIRQASLELFAEVLQTRAPSGAAEAETYFRLKYQLTSNFFSLEEVRSNQERLLMVADFLGEIRSRRIPNYKNQHRKVIGTDILYAAGVRHPRDLPPGNLKEAYAKAIEVNEENWNIDGLQLALRSVDSGIMHDLGYAKIFAADTSENLEFQKELYKRARLTLEELRKLGMPPPQ